MERSHPCLSGRQAGINGFRDSGAKTNVSAVVALRVGDRLSLEIKSFYVQIYGEVA